MAALTPVLRPPELLLAVAGVLEEDADSGLMLALEFGAAVPMADAPVLYWDAVDPVDDPVVVVPVVAVPVVVVPAVAASVVDVLVDVVLVLLLGCSRPTVMGVGRGDGSTANCGLFLPFPPLLSGFKSNQQGDPPTQSICMSFEALYGRAVVFSSVHERLKSASSSLHLHNALRADLPVIIEAVTSEALLQNTHICGEGNPDVYVTFTMSI
jgi:hypothetical protein